MQGEENLFFAGQMCGVEGYVESAASGLLAGINMALKMHGKEAVILPPTCMMGAMAHYITHTHAKSLSADERDLWYPAVSF